MFIILRKYDGIMACGNDLSQISVPKISHQTIPTAIKWVGFQVKSPLSNAQG